MDMTTRKGLPHMSRIIDLEHESQFRILLHPTRQDMVHLLRLAGRPMTANAVARRMNLSPISAQGHLKKLVDLGVVLMETRQGKNGEPLVLYSLDDVDIRLHLGKKDTFQGEREAMAANLVDGVFRGLVNTTHLHSEEELDQYCLLRFGALHLSTEERRELAEIVADYLNQHGTHTPANAEHWEYVIMAYRAPEEPKN